MSTIQRKFSYFHFVSTRFYSGLFSLSFLFFPNHGNASASEQHLYLDEAKKFEDIRYYDFATIDTSSRLPLVIHKTGAGTYHLYRQIINPPLEVKYHIEEGFLRADDSHQHPFVHNAHYIINEKGVLELEDHSITMASLSGSGEIRGWLTSTLTFNQNKDTEFSGNWSGGTSGTPALVKKGTGKFTLKGEHILLGNVFIEEGILAIGSNVLGLDFDRSDNRSKYPLTFNGGIFNNMGELDGLCKIRLESRGGTFDTQGDLIISDNIEGPGGLTKEGYAVLSLSGHNTYQGPTVLKEGTLKAEGANSFVQGGRYQIDGGLLDLNSFDLTMSRFSGNGGMVSLGLANLTIDQAVDTEFNGNIGGQGRLIKRGIGSLKLSGINSYEGISIEEGTLTVTQDENLGDSPGDLVFNGGALKNLGTFSTHRKITLKEKGGLFETQADLIVEGDIQGPGSLIKNNIGTLVLSGSNFYKGGTFVEEGILKAGSPTAFPQYTQYRVMKGGELDLNSYDLTVSELSGDGGFVSLGSAKLTVNQDEDTCATYLGSIIGSGDLIKTGLGQFTLSGDSTYQGETVVQKGTLAIDGSIQSNTVVIKPEGMLIGTGTIHGTVTNEGILSPGHSMSRFTIEGDYVGKDGLLRMEFSPESYASDQLIIKGHASGSTAVELIPLQALGGPLPENGIEMIKTSSSTPDAFFLASPLKAGAYSYDLVQGDNQNWSLRHVSPIPNVYQIIPMVSIVSPVLIAASPTLSKVINEEFLTTIQTLPTSISQITQTKMSNGFRVATQVFPLAPFLLQEYAANLIGSLHQRMGQQERLSERRDLKDKAHASNFWTRILGIDGRLNTYGDLKYDLQALQIGTDLYRASHDHLGFYGVLGKAKARVKVRDITLGNQDTNAPGLGAYWTHYGSRHQYLDTVLQITRYHNTLTTQLENDHLKLNTTGYTASMEGGYPFKLKHLTLEPQAQIIYQHLDLHTHQDRVSTITFDDPNSLRARIGLRLAHEGVVACSKVRACDFTLALTGNLWREFLAKNKTIFSTLQGRYPVGFAPDLSGTWAEVGIEGSLKMSRYINLYANGNYVQGLNSIRRRALGGSVGVRVNW